MATRIAFIFVIGLSLTACQRPATNNEPVQIAEAPEPKESAPEAVVTDEMIQAEREAQLAIQMAEEEFDMFLQERLGQGQQQPGEWIEKDGARICLGFLTRNADQDFCAAEVPADWVPFEFNGNTYYMQPLSEISE